jgi:flagellar basal body P-ring formation protein FlgA
MRSFFYWTSLFLTIACAVPAWGAEIQLRAQCMVTSPIVRLGNVAEVYSDDPREAAALAAIELMPSPPESQVKYLRLRELQDLLAGRGVNLAKIRFGGVSQVMIGQAAAANSGKVEVAAGPRLRLQDLKRAQDQVRDAATRYLREHGQTGAANVRSQLTDAQAQAVLRAGRRLVVNGPEKPTAGSQELEIVGEGDQGVLRFSVSVEVEAAQMVVVTTRAIPRGALIRPDDVQLAGAEVAAGADDFVTAIDAVIGREVAKTLPAGRPVEAAALRSPLMVRRGEVVTVHSRAAGIRVKTVARAKQDGSEGELVELESIPNRKTFLARVCGFQEAEVFARAIEADSSAGGAKAVRQ